MSEPTGRAEDLPREQPVNEMRVALYERLMDAQEQIARARHEYGLSHEEVLAVLDEADERLSEEERREDLYLSALAHYVEALGGRLEVRAVFGEHPVLLRVLGCSAPVDEP